MFNQINRILALKGPLFIQCDENLIELVILVAFCHCWGFVIWIWREQPMISIEHCITIYTVALEMML